MINCKIFFPLLEDQTKYDAKLSLFSLKTSKNFDLIRTEKIIEFDPNFLPVLNSDFEFNGEAYYQAYDFSFIKIQVQERNLALLIIEERYSIGVEIKSENNKEIKSDFNIVLNNCGIFQLKKNELIIKPNDVTYL